MIKRLSLFLILATACLTTASSAQTVITDASIVGDTFWTADTEYLLDGYVYVEDGETLTIEAGTVIKSKLEPTSDQASVLIVARGGKIFAEGTPDAPIIFTAEFDDVSDPTDYGPTDSQEWGGVIILGRATTNVGGGENFIEGLEQTDDRNLYGGSDDDDDSGVFRYVSIRHGGFTLGTDNEINGLTMGAVGRGTTIEYVEVFANKDDGYEWFGGTVNTKYLISAFNGDDGFDYDEGFRGHGQFWFQIQGADDAGSGGEHDGGTDPEDGQPYAIPVIHNATYIGAGVTGVPSSDRALNLRDNAGGKYYNSIFTEFAGTGIQIEDLASGEDSRERLEAGDLEIENNIWFGFGNITGDAIAGTGGLYSQAFVQAALGATNFNENPQLRGISRTANMGLDPRPASGSPALTRDVLAQPRDGFFTQTTYLGAFNSFENWTAPWSFIAEAGFISVTEVEPPASSSQVTITDASIVGDTFWTADTEYLLDGYVYVEDGETLTIEAGTVIKSKLEPTSDQASVLIVARGGKIFAEGTPDAPIIFTAEFDDVSDPTDYGPTDSQEWGGVIILGRATTNVGGGENFIEGLEQTDDRNLYGGSDDDDDSGVFRYVSIRHGGFTLGTDNEINGLTMGAVGRGTTIEYVEVFANKDDGYEWFGGTVNTKYLISAFNGDDGFDYDEGFRGHGQFWFQIQGADDAGSGGEHDGGTDPEDGQPYAIPVIHNATYIGAGVTGVPSSDRALNLRDNAGGKYYNSIFTEFAGTGIQIEDLASGEDSRERLEAGDLEIENNIWFGFGNITGDAIAGTGGLYSQAFVQAALGATNFNENPQLRGISRTANMGLDPRPASGSPALTRAVLAQPRDGFFTQTTYLGAFNGTDEANWLRDWTFTSQGGFTTTAIEQIGTEIPVSISLEQNYPNPFNPTTNIEFQLDRTQQVRLSVHDVLGREVAILVDGMQTAGSFVTRFDASRLASGTYFYRLSTPNSTVTKMMTLVR